MVRVVISQPFLFPWVGYFEQTLLADVFVHYDDVAFSKGSFVNRVQLKSAKGPVWMTIPIAGRHFGDRIAELRIDNSADWRTRHLSLLKELYAGAPYATEMLELVRNVYACETDRLVPLLYAGIVGTCDYLGLKKPRYYCSSELGIEGRSSRRVLQIVQHFGANSYVTGHGARNYLDHELFEHQGVHVLYMNYRRNAYPQQFGAFDPHVSILDLIANCGPGGAGYLSPSTLGWREFLDSHRRAS